MSKWFGKIGLVQTVETEPSIFEEKVTGFPDDSGNQGYSFM